MCAQGQWRRIRRYKKAGKEREAKEEEKENEREKIEGKDKGENVQLITKRKHNCG